MAAEGSSKPLAAVPTRVGLRACEKDETGILGPNNRRQHRTWHI
jgi:hypothetical protein